MLRTPRHQYIDRPQYKVFVFCISGLFICDSANSGQKILDLISTIAMLVTFMSLMEISHLN